MKNVEEKEEEEEEDVKASGPQRGAFSWVSRASRRDGGPVIVALPSSSAYNAGDTREYVRRDVALVSRIIGISFINLRAIEKI